MQKEARKKYHPCPFSGPHGKRRSKSPDRLCSSRPSFGFGGGTVAAEVGVLFANTLFFQRAPSLPPHTHIRTPEIWWGGVRE